jgi:hypothetical protein
MYAASAEADACEGLLWRLHNQNRAPANSRKIMGIAMPIPAFAPVERPLLCCSTGVDVGVPLELEEYPLDVTEVPRVDEDSFVCEPVLETKDDTGAPIVERYGRAGVAVKGVTRDAIVGAAGWRGCEVARDTGGCPVTTPSELVRPRNTVCGKGSTEDCTAIR